MVQNIFCIAFLTTLLYKSYASIRKSYLNFGHKTANFAVLCVVKNKSSLIVTTIFRVAYKKFSLKGKIII
jgi:hypothetical protein